MKGYFSKQTIPPRGGEGLKHPNAIGRELRAGSLWLDSSLFPANDRGEIWVEEGLILAKTQVSDTGADDTTYGPTYKYVPYSAAASYGALSDVPVGVLDVLVNLNYESDQMVSPVIHSQLITAACYVYGQEKGVVSNTVKSALSGIFWV